MLKRTKVRISSSGRDAWQEEFDAGYSEAYEQSFRQSQLAERNRLGRIFSSPEAVGEGRFEAARVMAFHSTLNAEVVEAILAATDRSHPELAVERAWNAARSAAAVELSDPWQNDQSDRPSSGSVN